MHAFFNFSFFFFFHDEQSYSVRDDKWTSAPVMTVPRYGLAAVVVRAPL